MAAAQLPTLPLHGALLKVSEAVMKTTPLVPVADAMMGACCRDRAEEHLMAELALTDSTAASNMK
jgi:hypothetical protein